MRRTRFQSTHPLRGATFFCCHLLRSEAFQSTHPLRGATHVLGGEFGHQVISIHAPLAGCDRLRKTRNATRTRFQSTHPLRGATSVSLYLSDQHTVFQSTHPLRGATGGQSHPVVPFHPISIHAPLAGCDSAISAMPSASPNFNPHTPCGVRPDYLDKRAAAYDFNPRTPCGVRRRADQPPPLRRHISIHAPLAGCDAEGHDYGAEQLISIHAPLAGCDCDGKGAAWTDAISIHAPLAGCDASAETLCHIPRPFQSTHPLRGATKAVALEDAPIDISIHAPLAGCDKGADVTKLQTALFQSTHPLRGATLYCDHPPLGALFQSTHPLRGATFPCRSSCKYKTISIHAPLAGCDGRDAQRVIYRINFNPRTPCGVRPRHRVAGTRHQLFQSTHPLRGATSGIIADWLPIAHFNPRTPCGVRPVWPRIRRSTARFQSTHPLRGATFQSHSTDRSPH